MIEIRDGLPLAAIVGGTIGGALILIILLVFLMLLSVVKCWIGHRQGQCEHEGIETKENEAYVSVSMATLDLAGQPQALYLQTGDTQISRNPCYATTQHIEVVDNECYDRAPESQPIDRSGYARV